MDFTTRVRNAIIATTRGYFSSASDIIVSDYDVPYYDGEDFFDLKHRLNVHYHAPSAISPDEGEAPKQKKSLPVVVFIHGGGWKRGDRNYFFDAYNNVGKAIAAEGFVVVVPSYRLSMAVDGGVKHPKHAHDVAYALRWVKDNIARYDGNPDMVFLSGHSAGGHLASLLALDVTYLADVGIEPDFVKGVVGMCGVYDLVHGYSRYMLRSLYLIDAFGHDHDVLRAASPVHHARSNAPPFLLLNAWIDFGLENDALLLRANLLAFEGNAVEHQTYRGTNHATIIGLGPALGTPYAPLIQDTCAWLKKQVARLVQDQDKDKERQKQTTSSSDNDNGHGEGGQENEKGDLTTTATDSPTELFPYATAAAEEPVTATSPPEESLAAHLEEGAPQEAQI